MDTSTLSDCVLLDNSIPVIALDETVDETTVDEPESGEDISQDSSPENGNQGDQNFTKRKMMSINFPDEENMQKFGPELIEFMQQKCANLAVELDNKGWEISFFEKVLVDESETSDTPKFTIDSTPSKGRPGAGDVPRYNQSTAEALSNDKERAGDKNGSASRRALTCFNCDGDHNLRDCTEPRDQRRINANRKMKGKTERYHVDLSQKYGHLRPGQISSKLQKALGLKSKDLPVHIFRMRKLGYPPGWLEEAKVSHSGINLFGSDGAVVLESDDEDGQVEQIKDKYDASKVIEYPGFNVDAPEDAYDDSKMFNCPPMQEEHRKENFLVNLGANVAKAYKRRKMNSFPMNESGVQAGAMDMDMDTADEVDEEEDGEIKESAPPLPAEPTDKEQMLPPPPAAKDKSDGLDGEIATATASAVNDSLIDFIINREDAEEDGEQSEITSAPSKSILVSKQVVEGTPLLKSASSYDKLPEGDKWSVGVSDVINFENLPDSVGKYEKMKVLLKKVGSAVRQINSE